MLFLNSCGKTTLNSGSSSTVETCQIDDISASPAMVNNLNNVDAKGSNQAIEILAKSNCQWYTDSSDNWLVIDHGSDLKIGPQSLKISILENPSSLTRESTMVITLDPTRNSTNTLVIKVTQVGQECKLLSLFPSTATLPPAESKATFSVNTIQDCSWTATKNDPWVKFPNGENRISVTSTGNVTFNVSENPGPPPDRHSSIKIALNTTKETQAPIIFSINQLGKVPQGVNCNLSDLSIISPENLIETITSSEQSIEKIQINTQCQWIASTKNEWIRFEENAGTSIGKTGSAQITYHVEENSESKIRNGQIDLALANDLSKFITISVVQPAASVPQTPTPPTPIPPTLECSYSNLTLMPTRSTVEIGGENNKTFSIVSTNPEACTWTATASDSHITNTSVSGSSVIYSVGANRSSTPYTGHITINFTNAMATQIGTPIDFEITQNGISQCDYSKLSLSSGGATLPSSGSSDSFTVTNDNSISCPWVATPSDPRIRLNNPLGPTVTYTLDAYSEYVSFVGTVSITFTNTAQVPIGSPLTFYIAQNPIPKNPCFDTCDGGKSGSCQMASSTSVVQNGLTVITQKLQCKSCVDGIFCGSGWTQCSNSCPNYCESPGRTRTECQAPNLRIDNKTICQWYDQGPTQTRGEYGCHPLRYCGYIKKDDCLSGISVGCAWSDINSACYRTSDNYCKNCKNQLPPTGEPPKWQLP